jgi:hypothetical protein
MPCLSGIAEGAKIIVYLQTKFLYIFYYDTFYYNIFCTKVLIYFVVIEIIITFALRNLNSSK